MNVVRSPIPQVIPENAPFTPEQRVWLNGLFAGLFSLDGVSALSMEQSAALMPGGPAAEIDDGAPWHDQTMPIADRMKLAEGKPLRRRMMAVMGQQDCGQCGYNCEQYADAIAGKAEAKLNLCVPGGKDTARALKALYAELNAPSAIPAAPPTVALPAVTAPSSVIPPGRSRDHPVEATFVSRTVLNKPGSQKETWHIEFDLSKSGIDYVVGDSFGIYPVNDGSLVDAVMAQLGVPADFRIGERTFHDTLRDGVSLGAAPDMLFQLISYLVGGDRRQKAKELAAGRDPDGDAATLDVLAALEKFPGIRPDPEAFIEALDPLQPRLYSISSSPRIDPGRLSLTVDAVRYPVGSRLRLGCASTHLAERLKPGDKLRVYVQRAQHFALPADPNLPIIMIGPGTGIAPFRAFLHDRMASKAPGRNWLFFGHQRRDHDFFYEDELIGMRAMKHLTRLTLAWSRDADEKIYVQHRMADVARDLWAWITEGAHIYVCGDAQRMAKDVERALIEIIAAHGARSPEQAVSFLGELKRTNRYQADVY